MVKVKDLSTLQGSVGVLLGKIDKGNQSEQTTGKRLCWKAEFTQKYYKTEPTGTQVIQQNREK